jgi:hypothetical protein
MSPFFDDLESQLRGAAHDQVAARHAGRLARLGERLHRGVRSGGLARRLGTVVGALAVVAVVVVVMVVAIPRHHASAPGSVPAHPTPAQLLQLPPKQLQHLYAYIARATKPVQSSAACRQGRSDDTPLHRDPPAALTRQIGVLRRPATSADRGIPRGYLSGLGARVYSGHVRLARSAGGVRYWLIPALTRPGAGGVSLHCLALVQRAVDRTLPSIPRADRADTRALMAATIHAARTLLKPGPEVCLVAAARHGSTGSCEALRSIGTWLGVDSQVQQSRAIAMITTDAVRSVSVTFSSERGRRAVSATARSNLALVVPPRGYPRIAEVVWRGDHGRVLRRIDTSNARQELCRREPSVCLLLRGGIAVGSGSSSTSTSTSASESTPSAPSKRGGSQR